MSDSTVALMERHAAPRNGQPAITDFDKDLIRRTVAVGATDDELALYLHDCERRGVHPLDRLLHFTIRVDKRGNRKYTPITSIDLFRARAGATGEHAGTDDAAFVTEDGCNYPASATVTAYRIVQGQRCPFPATARWKEYRPTTDAFMWDKMPYTMLGKCAEALALRKAFPAELGGLYTADEMAQAPAVDPHMTLEANSLSPQEQLKARQANPQPAKKEYCSQAQYDALRDIGDDLGLTPEERAAILKPYGVQRGRSLSPEQAAEAILTLCRRRVTELLTELAINLDDVRVEAPSVAADTPDELDQAQADAALTVLRRCKENASR